MRVISAEQLKNKLDRGDNFKLVMTMNRWAYDRMHIPGSLHFNNLGEAMAQLTPDDEIVVYCSTKWCHQSIEAYLVLRRQGFNKLYRFAGGLEEWMDAGYPLEGEIVNDFGMKNGGKTMYARVMIGQVKPKELGEADSAIRTYQDSIVPAARQQKGFKGVFLLTNPQTGKAISITLWETESDMMESEAGDYYQEQIARIASILAGPGTVDHYQLSVQAGAQLDE